MSKLISTYARAVGLKISRPNVKQCFYPLPFSRYITIQSGSNQAAKNYSYFNDTLNLIRPMLAASQIGIVHLGTSNDPVLPGVHDLRDKTTFQQANYLISNSLCHIGTDSFLAHCAGWNRRPLVALFGSTSVANHGPYWYDVDKTILLESHRGGGRPTYVMNEGPKTIDYISPETVANAVLRLLGIAHQFTHQSRFFGTAYQQPTLELIPNVVPAPHFIPELPITVRLDYLHNEDVLAQVCQTGRKVNIITSRPVNIGLLQAFRPSILSYHHELGVPEAEAPSLDYVGMVKTLCPRNTFFTRMTDERKLAELRFTYFDTANIEMARDVTKEDYLAGALVYLNRPDTPENRLALQAELTDTNGRLRCRSTKYLLSENKVFPSLAHHHANLPLSDLNNNVAEVIDVSAFWRDVNYTTIFYEPSST